MPTDLSGTPTSLGIGTYNTSIDAPSGLGFNTAMGQLDVLFQTRVTVAGSSVWKNKLLSADTQPAFQINGDGKINWGAGGSSAVDANLYRTAPGILRMDGSLSLGGNLTPSGFVGLNASAPGVTAFAAAVTGDVANRYLVDSNGKINWGSGSGAADTNLYRSSAATLRTDSTFIVASSTGIGFISDTAKLQWGSGAFPGDTVLYRDSATVLKTDGSFRAAGYLDVAFGGTGQLRFGSALDTNLYRGSAGLLQTDGEFKANLGRLISNRANATDIAVNVWKNGNHSFDIRGDGKHEWADGAGGAFDTNLYRSAVGTLKSDGNVHVASAISIGTNNRVQSAGELYLDVGTAPSTAPTTGGIIYVDTADNKLKYKGSSGTITIIALP